LDWKLRNDPRVVVMERTNAMHAKLPELVRLVTIDAGWTRQRHILPSARRMVADDGNVVSLVKPHYEANPPDLRGGVLPAALLPKVFERVVEEIKQSGFTLIAVTKSPNPHAGGNIELLVWLRPA